MLEAALIRQSTSQQLLVDSDTALADKLNVTLPSSGLTPDSLPDAAVDDSSQLSSDLDRSSDQAAQSAADAQRDRLLKAATVADAAIKATRQRELAVAIAQRLID